MLKTIQIHYNLSTGIDVVFEGTYGHEKVVFKIMNPLSYEDGEICFKTEYPVEAEISNHIKNTGLIPIPSVLDVIVMNNGDFKQIFGEFEEIIECGSDFLLCDRYYIIIFEFIEGNSLTPEDIKNNQELLASYVQNLHDCGIVHNDIKSNNFIINKGKITMIDFGASFNVDYYKDHSLTWPPPSCTIEDVEVEGNYVCTKTTDWMNFILMSMRPPIKSYMDFIQCILSFDAKTQISKANYKDLIKILSRRFPQ